MLFDEPKLLNREVHPPLKPLARVSVLFDEPKLLNDAESDALFPQTRVSVLFDEPKLLNIFVVQKRQRQFDACFSALRRAEIAERRPRAAGAVPRGVSVLFDEPKLLKW